MQPVPRCNTVLNLIPNGHQGYRWRIGRLEKGLECIVYMRKGLQQPSLPTMLQRPTPFVCPGNYCHLMSAAKKPRERYCVQVLKAWWRPSDLKISSCYGQEHHLLSGTCSRPHRRMSIGQTVRPPRSLIDSKQDITTLATSLQFFSHCTRSF